MCFIPVYILILAATIIIDYFAAIAISKSAGKKRKTFLIISLIANIGILAFFKYYGFLNDIITSVLYGSSHELLFPSLTILLPIGLSFHTFQAMSYTIEVYRGNQQPEKHFGIYALYVMFFPQLVAGPIERPQNLLHQFRVEHNFDYQRVVDGLKLMAWGFFKKVVIADRIAMVIDPVFNDVTKYEGFPLVLSSVLFAFQIYCDFSGYSDIAIGGARVLGFNLMKNFDRPFFAKSISEMWRRWHISLSSWFSDYVYKPMGGSRVNIFRQCFNLMIVFFISGLWHGANYTFIVWGLLNGLIVIVEVFLKKPISVFFYFLGIKQNTTVKKIIQCTYTFTLFCFTFIFFRAKSMHDAFYVIENLFTNFYNSFVSFIEQVFYHHSYISSPAQICLIILFSIVILNLLHLKDRKVDILAFINQKPKWKRWVIYYVITFSILFFGALGESDQFIYFQF